MHFHWGKNKSHSTCKYSRDCSDCFVQFVVMSFSFYFLNALQSDINSNRVYVLGHKYVLGPSQAHFSPRLAARAKMSLSRAQNIFMPANINSIVIFVFHKGSSLAAASSFLKFPVIVTSSFWKSSIFTIFCVHIKTKSRQFQFFPVWEVFLKSSVFVTD